MFGPFRCQQTNRFAPLVLRGAGWYVFSHAVFLSCQCAGEKQFRRKYELASVLKWWIVPAFKAPCNFEPEEYIKYFEDSESPPNAEIECMMPFPDGH